MTEKSFAPIFAVYDTVGRLSKIKTGENISVSSGETKISTVTINKKSLPQGSILKAMVWDINTMTPYTNAQVVTETVSDFYGNSFETASYIGNIDKQISGMVNTVEDVDYFRFTAPENGTYIFNCFSINNIYATLQNSSGSVIKEAAEEFEVDLTAGELYYIKISGTSAGEYLVTVNENLLEESENFDVYKFDADTNIYKKSIIEICKNLNTSLAKQMYGEYEEILNDDIKLHRLPGFLSGHPKGVTNFDDLLNRYYGTKYEEFESLKQRYTQLIDDYTYTQQAASAELLDIGDDEEVYPISLKYYPSEAAFEETETVETTVQTVATTEAEPSLTIVSTTETSITYDVTFPVSGQWGNEIRMVDFNTGDGFTTWNDIYDDYYRKNGRYVISNLSPGGIYILTMIWKTDENLGYQPAINRFVQLPDNTTENLVMYSGDRVSARIELSDKTLATNTDFNIWLSRMDDVYKEYKELTGYTPYNSKKIEIKSTRDNLNEMFSNEDGQYYYWVTYGYFDGTNVFKYGRAYYKGLLRRLSAGDWGWLPMHEMSHVFDNSKWNFDSETLAQFKTYYAMEQLNAKVYDCNENENVSWYEGDEYYDYLKSARFMQSYANSFGNGTYASEGFAALLIDIQKQTGWDAFKKTFRYFSILSSSQIPSGKGGKLKLFLTKLKDFSGEDVLEMMSDEDKQIIESHFGIKLEYVDPIYPSISTGGSSGGNSSEIIADRGNYTVHQFTPATSDNYYIYTSPYGGSGVSNDTYIEVYANSQLSGTPIASNDDYGGGRFSKVSVAMTAWTTYYIKVRHYSDGQLHAELNITKNIPVQQLTNGSYADIITASGEFSVFSFTPEISTTYVFEVTSYNNETTEYDPYIKLYENEDMTGRIGYNSKKIMVRLQAGHTYYLQFSGFLMKYARGRINLRQGQILEFTKKTDSSFIYVNNPEFITQEEIVDENGVNRTKIFEQQNVSGKNTYYQTHVMNIEVKEWFASYPTEDFYVDVDFYNPNDTSVTVDISNLAYTTFCSFGEISENDMRTLQNYISGGITLPTITIPAKSHVLLFDNELFVQNNSQLKLSSTSYDRMCLLFDFNVSGGEITVSSLAAKSRANLVLATGSEDVLTNGTELKNGEIAYIKRDNEPDLYDKYKGIARNQSNCISAKLEFAIDDSTETGVLPIQLKDSYYDETGVWGINNTWLSSANPTYGGWNTMLYAMPGNLHSFTYHYENTERLWHFDFEHRNTNYTNFTATDDTSVNDKISDEILSRMKADVAVGHNSFDGAVDTNALGMGSWGVLYRYNITVANNGTKDRLIDFNVDSTNYLIVGSKTETDTDYTFNYYPLDEGKKTPVTVTLPKNSITSFEVVTLYGLSDSGLWHELVLRDVE